AGYREPAQLARLDLREYLEWPAEEELDLPAKQVDDRWGAALVRDVDHVSIGHLQEKLGRQMRHGAGAGRAERKAARFRAHKLDELLQIGRLHGRVHRDYERPGGGQRERRD